MLLGFELNTEDNSAMGEVLGGIITEIGFVGSGAILKKDGIVKGTSTAAAIWLAVCVGVAVAMGRLEIAVLISLFTFMIFHLANPLIENIDSSDECPLIFQIK